MPTSGFYGASLFRDAFMNLLREKAKMLLRTLPTSDWFDRALRCWEQNIFPTLTEGGCIDLSFNMAPEAFKDGARITHHKWAKDIEEWGAQFAPTTVDFPIVCSTGQSRSRSGR